jgi:hypothetical protein
MQNKPNAERLLLPDGNDFPLAEEFRPKQKTGVKNFSVEGELILLDRQVSRLIGL